MQRKLMELIAIVVLGYSLAAATSPQIYALPYATTVTTLTATERPTSVALPVPDIADELFARINQLRESLGLAPYILNDALQTAARDQAQWMASNGIVTHIRPDGNTPCQRALAAGYSESPSCSEIIYMGRMATLESAWNFWMTSKIHYAELTNPRHRDAGAGVFKSTEFGHAFVVVFGGYIVPTLRVSPLASPGTYIVQPGDTLYRIAVRYGVPLATLAAANRIGINDTLYIGQVLVIPQSTVPVPTLVPTATLTLVPVLTLTPSQTGTLRYHIVRHGETLLQISRKYGVPLETIIAANGLTNPDRIAVGQVLIIP